METETRRSGRVAAARAAVVVPPPPPPPVARKSSRHIFTFQSSKPKPKVVKKPPPPKKKPKKKQRVNPKRKSLPTFLHDAEGNQVWIAALLAGDIKRAAKTGKHPMNQKRQYLHTVNIPSYREQIYERTAQAWMDLEEALLPSYGGRKWKVKITIKDPVNTKGHKVSPFFCFRQGSLEIAVWPHWLLSIPHPPKYAGYGKTASKAKLQSVGDDQLENEDDESEEEEEEEEEESEEEEEFEELQTREVSSLSELAMSERWRVPMPSYSIKWLSPLRETFSTRKSAWEHAKKLCQQEVFLDKMLSGYNANGEPITKIVTPGAKTVLKAGHLRFLRDGLWVVGQEEIWQRQRLEEMDSLKAVVVTPPTTPRTMSPLALYIQENRKQHQAKRLSEMSLDGEKPSFTLREAETELREMWKNLPDKDKEMWINRTKHLKEGEGSSKPRQLIDVADGKASAKDSSAAEISGKEKEISSIAKDATTPSAVASRNNVGNIKDSLDDTDGKPIAITTDQTPVRPLSARDAIASHAGRVTPPSETETQVQPRRVSCSSKVLSVEYPEPQKKASKYADEAVVDQAKLDVVRSDKQAENKKPSPLRVPLKPSPSKAWCLDDKQIKLCHDAGLEHFDRVLETVKVRDLTREFHDGFDVLRERGKGRYDMELPEFDEPKFDFFTSLKKAPWMPIVRQILGKDVVLIHKGIFLSLPGAATQDYHQDGPHLTTQYQKPCHAINVFVPLVDLDMANGPTEFCLGSHILDHEDYNEDNIETPTAKAGSPIIFDYRLGHRGLANNSDSNRPVLYCTYAAASDGKEFRDSVNFSRRRYHKIGDMVTKAISRDERALKRQKH